MLYPRISFSATLLLTFLLGTTLAISAEEDHLEVEVENYSTTPLIQPTVEDFAPSAESEFGDSPIGVNGYFETSEKLKVFSLTPSYKFSKKLKMKLRLPYIIESVRTGWFGEETASGLGDIGIEGEYTHEFSGPTKLLRLQATLKLPTGDNENLEGADVKMPLGTGSVDFLIRGQYTQSTKKSGFLASALFRINDSGEAIYENVSGGVSTTESITQTNGNQFVASVFGRHVVGQGIWLNLGASVMMSGEGEKDSGDPFIDDLFNQKSSLFDLYPGVSYQFGPITPYLGARIPLSTSYDDVNRAENRDTVFIFQVTYRPFSMVD